MKKLMIVLVGLVLTLASTMNAYTYAATPDQPVHGSSNVTKVVSTAYNDSVVTKVSVAGMSDNKLLDQARIDVVFYTPKGKVLTHRFKANTLIKGDSGVRFIIRGNGFVVVSNNEKLARVKNLHVYVHIRYANGETVNGKNMVEQKHLRKHSKKHVFKMWRDYKA